MSDPLTVIAGVLREPFPIFFVLARSRKWRATSP
jgi:membrane protein YqaA with SNARE-associated domain